MSEFTSTVSIDAPADQVFEFVSIPENLPKFLPTLHEAHAEGSDQITMDGEADGHPYHATGEFKLEPDERIMRWGSESMHKYSGQLQVTGDEKTSHVSVKLNFEPGEKMKQAVEEEEGNSDEVIRQALDHSLQSIKAQCEGVKSESKSYMG